MEIPEICGKLLKTAVIPWCSYSTPGEGAFGSILVCTFRGPTLMLLMRVAREWNSRVVTQELFPIIDEAHKDVSFEELEAVYAKSYEEVFDENTFMDEAELEVLLTKEEKEAQARLACWNINGT